MSALTPTVEPGTFQVLSSVEVIELAREFYKKVLACGVVWLPATRLRFPSPRSLQGRTLANPGCCSNAMQPLEPPQ